MYTYIRPKPNKTVLFFVFLLIALMTTTFSCKKSNASSGSSAIDTVTTEDAAYAVMDAVSPESAGMVAQTQTIVVIINSNDLACGEEKDTSIRNQSTSGAAITYSYAYSSSRLLTCNDGLPSSFQFDFSGKNSYSAAYIASNDSASGQFAVTGLEAGASQYVFNTSYIRHGSETSKVRNQLTFTSTIDIQSNNLTVDKSIQQIVSGTAAVSISGEASNGNGRSFSYTGTITFLGNNKATLVLGNGSSYSIAWS
jgi:hypothetical protein